MYTVKCSKCEADMKSIEGDIFETPVKVLKFRAWQERGWQLFRKRDGFVLCSECALAVDGEPKKRREEPVRGGLFEGML